MRLNKNTRKRNDGRYEWQKMIGGVWYREIDRNKEKLAEKVRIRLETIKEVFRKEVEQKQLSKHTNRKLMQLAWNWFYRYKENKIVSASKYKSVIENHICSLNKNIETYSKDDIQDFLNEITACGTALYCYDTLKGVFAEAYDNGIIKRNVIVNLKRPKNTHKKGTWIDVDGQQRILDNL